MLNDKYDNSNKRAKAALNLSPYVEASLKKYHELNTSVSLDLVSHCMVF